MHLTQEARDSLRQYLDWSVEARKKFSIEMDSHYCCFEDFVAQEGTMFTEISPDHPRQGKINRYSMRALRQCFHNSYAVAVASKGNLRYVEGYASGIIPVLHAWNIDSEGRVVDTTWCGDGSDIRPPTGVAYMGVILDLRLVLSIRSAENASVIDQWEKGWPLLQKKYNSKAVPA